MSATIAKTPFRLKPLTRALATAAIALTLSLLAAPESQARSLEEAVASGTINVGIQGDNSPWGFVNSSGQQDGFDADVAKAYAKHLGVQVNFMPLAVANRIPALTTDRVDVLFATMGMTAERAKSIQYTQPYASNQISIVAAKDTKVTEAADLAPLNIGVPRAAAQDSAATAVAPAGTNIMRFDDDAATIQALLSGQVNAVGANQFYLQRLETARPGVYESKINLIALYNGAGTRMGEADWNQSINAFLTEFIASDEYKAIYDKWMHLPPPSFPASMEGIPYTVTAN